MSLTTQAVQSATFCQPPAAICLKGKLEQETSEDGGINLFFRSGQNRTRVAIPEENFAELTRQAFAFAKSGKEAMVLGHFSYVNGVRFFVAVDISEAK